jgi:hypothetical protein
MFPKNALGAFLVNIEKTGGVPQACKSDPKQEGNGNESLTLTAI